MKINLEAKGNDEIRLLKYLEENASDVLAEKINNGVTVEKDGTTLIMKKDFKGFMKYAVEEAKKLAEKGAMGTYVDDMVVFGWLIHYFEEDSITGNYFNLDGTPYTPPKKETKKAKTTSTVTPTVTPTAPPKKKAEPQGQFSLFDMLNLDGDNPDELPILPVEEPVVEEKEVITPAPTPQTSPFYSKYMEVQDKHPTAVVLYRLGDFYEVFGDNAKILANELELTLTGRDCGLESRVPMIGFPCHRAAEFMTKIHDKHDMVIFEKDDIQFIEMEKEPEKEPEKHWIDEFTYVDENGEVHEIEKPSLKVPEWLLNMFGKEIIGR